MVGSGAEVGAFDYIADGRCGGVYGVEIYAAIRRGRRVEIDLMDGVRAISASCEKVHSIVLGFWG